MKLTFFSDRHPQSDLKERHPELFAHLLLNQSASPAHDTIHFCGLVVLDHSKSYMFLPRNTVDINLASENELLSIGTKVMSTLVRFGREADRVALTATEGSSGTIAPLISEIAKDYRDYGIYSERLRISGKNAGKIDWKKTISGELPYVEDNRLIYLNFRTTRPVNSQDNVLSLIQAAILREIFEFHSWWLGSSLGNRQAPEPVLLRWPRDQWITLLQKFMTGLFSDRPLRLAKMLCDYLMAQNANIAGAMFFGLRDFHNVWEAMLKNCLTQTESNWTGRLPRPAYFAQTGRREIIQGMIPDVIIRAAGRITVIDAKYYSATTTSNSPALADILKQISYVNAVGTVEPDTEIDTCFVFPAKKPGHGVFDKVMFLGRDGKSVPKFLEIRCEYVAVTNLIDLYISHRRVPFSDLVKTPLAEEEE